MLHTQGTTGMPGGLLTTTKLSPRCMMRLCMAQQGVWAFTHGAEHLSCKQML